MKKISYSFSKKTPLSLTFLLLLFVAVSCKKQKTEDKQPPVITAVTNLEERNVALISTDYAKWIIIKGKHLATTYKVDFNSIAAADSLFYADDTSVTVKIPVTLPDPADNPITVTTKYGTATYNFKILQPAPVITSFDPVAGPSVAEVTIYGLYLGGTTSVKFDNAAAEIISNTKTEVKVKVPAGVTYGYIYVTTQSGTVKSGKVYGFRYELFTDAITSGWTFSPSSSNVVYNAAVTDTIKRGTNSVRMEFKAAWSYLRFIKSAALSISGYQGLKFSMYAASGFQGKKVRIYLNAATTNTYTITVNKTNEWVDYEIPFTNFGSPATLTQIAFNEFSGTATFPRHIFVDDLGLY